MMFVLIFIKAPSVVVGLCEFFPSTQFPIVHYPYSNTNAEMTEGHSSKVEKS
jgi:hypothetical protein